MSRYQFRHGRTLDAVELRGGKSIQARDVRVGDTVMFTSPQFDYTVTDIEPDSVGGLRFRSGHGLSTCYLPDEYVYVNRADLRHKARP